MAGQGPGCPAPSRSRWQSPVSRYKAAASWCAVLAPGTRTAPGTGANTGPFIHPELADDLDDAIRQAITGLRASGYSWADIAARLGITRQGAQQRWGGDTP